MLNYGLGLLSSYFVCDTLTILSGGYFYIFDPLGLTGGATSTATSSARYFSLLGAELDHSIYSYIFFLLCTLDITCRFCKSISPQVTAFSFYQVLILHFGRL